MTPNNPTPTDDEDREDPAPDPLRDSKHEAFALGIARGLEPAYAFAFAGYSSKNPQARAARLLQDPGITARVDFLRVALPRAEKLIAHHAPSLLLMPASPEEMAAFLWQVTTGLRPIRPHQLRAAHLYCRLKGWHRLKPKDPVTNTEATNDDDTGEPNKKKSKDQEVKFAGGQYIDPVTGRRRLFPPDDPDDPTAFVNPDGSITKGNNRILPGGWIDTPYIVWPENLHAEPTPVPLDFVPSQNTEHDNDNPSSDDTATEDQKPDSDLTPIGPAEREHLYQIVKDTVEADLAHRVLTADTLDLHRTGLCAAWYDDLEPLIYTTPTAPHLADLTATFHRPFP